VKVIKGPNIKPIPIKKPLSRVLSGKILLKVGDDITTDHILPAGANILPLRSNIPALSEHLFAYLDKSFVARAKKFKGGFVVGGENYGQGSSREHAALAAMYIGVKAIVAKSFARIHKANLINFGILPLEFGYKRHYEELESGDSLKISRIRDFLKGKRIKIPVENITKGVMMNLRCNLTPRSREIIALGGYLNYTKKRISNR
jgi:aconitate hydratase